MKLENITSKPSFKFIRTLGYSATIAVLLLSCGSKDSDITRRAKELDDAVKKIEDARNNLEKKKKELEDAQNAYQDAQRKLQEAITDEANKRNDLKERAKTL